MPYFGQENLSKQVRHQNLECVLIHLSAIYPLLINLLEAYGNGLCLPPPFQKMNTFNYIKIFSFYLPIFLFILYLLTFTFFLI